MSVKTNCCLLCIIKILYKLLQKDRSIIKANLYSKPTLPCKMKLDPPIK